MSAPRQDPDDDSFAVTNLEPFSSCFKTHSSVLRVNDWRLSMNLNVAQPSRLRVCAPSQCANLKQAAGRRPNAESKDCP